MLIFNQDKESADEKARTTKKTATKKGKPGKPVKTEDEDNKKKQKSISKPKRKTPKRKTPLKDRKKYDGFCPRCQMPYALFVIETPTWHEAECFESYRPELGSNVSCSSTYIVQQLSPRKKKMLLQIEKFMLM